VAQRKLQTVLAEFLRSLQGCRKLSAEAYRWSSRGANGARPHISPMTRDYITEIAFLRAFLAWEVFVEESFILYLIGQKPPRGRAPHRYAFPPNQRTAMEWLVPEGRQYAQWIDPGLVSARAERFFLSGRPFAPVLRNNLSVLGEARTIRNAIAHKSTAAREKFETLVRTKLTTLPPSLTVGGFLGKTIPGSTPPVSFMESYLARIDFAARQIVPSEW
jgi:hypothetical protein